MAVPSRKPSKRAVDKLAGKGSLAERLKKHRHALESGDASGGKPVVGRKKKRR